MAQSARPDPWDNFFNSAANRANSNAASTGGMLGQAEQNQNQTVQQSGTSVISNMSPQAMMMLKVLLGNQGNSILAGADSSSVDFSKSAALQDSEPLVKRIKQALTSQDLPTLFNSAAGAGVYNSTSESLGADKLVAESGQKAAEAQSNMVGAYGNLGAALKDTELQNFLRGIQTAKSANEITDYDLEQDTKVKQDASGLSGLIGSLFGRLGGG